MSKGTAGVNHGDAEGQRGIYPSERQNSMFMRVKLMFYPSAGASGKVREASGVGVRGLAPDSGFAKNVWRHSWGSRIHYRRRSGRRE